MWFFATYSIHLFKVWPASLLKRKRNTKKGKKKWKEKKKEDKNENRKIINKYQIHEEKERQRFRSANLR